jgi:hypothetical protein
MERGLRAGSAVVLRHRFFVGAFYSPNLDRRSWLGDDAVEEEDQSTSRII